MFNAYITKVNDETELQNKLLEALEFVNWKNYVKSDTTVFVKPNFTYPVYDRGVTTSPVLLKKLLEILTKRGSRVILGESDGGYHAFKAEEGFEGHGAYDICKELGVELVNLCKLPSKVVKSKIQGKNVEVLLPELLLNDVDCVVSVPVLKVHVMTKVTLGIKNLWGCFPNCMRILCHENFERKITLIAKILNPILVVIDGLYALDEHGPMLGTPVKTDLLLASNNPVVADSLGTSIMGMNPREIKHLLIAEREGLGTTDLDKVTFNTNWQIHKKSFTLNRTIIDRLNMIPFRSTPISKIVFDSSLTPLIYKVVNLLKSPEERMLFKRE